MDEPAGSLEGHRIAIFEGPPSIGKFHILCITGTRLISRCTASGLRHECHLRKRDWHVVQLETFCIAQQGYAIRLFLIWIILLSMVF